MITTEFSYGKHPDSLLEYWL